MFLLQVGLQKLHFLSALGKPDQSICVLLACCLTSYTSGLIGAFPSVLNSAIVALDADIKATSDQASWIAACLGISAIPALTIVPSIFEIFGRKTINVLTNVVFLIGCIIQYLANSVHTLALSRICQGIALPGLDTFIYGLSECTTPQRRGYFMVLNKVSVGLGALTCHFLALILNWRQIAIVTTIPPCLAIILSVISRESPSYFAFKGNFDKCVKSFEWYRGDLSDAKMELKELIAAQTENFRMKQMDKKTNVYKKTKNMLMSKDFRKSLFIVALAKLSIDATGRHFMLAYITQILVEILDNQSLAMYLSVVSDIIIVSALCISCILVKRFSRRALLFNFGFFSVFVMFIISLALILGNRINFLHHIKWLTPILVLIHSFVAHIGLVPLAFTLGGEVFPLEHRGFGLLISGIISLTFYTFLMKIIPVIMNSLGVEGVYSICGSFLLFSLISLRIILIETKDKTLQQIEDELKGVVRNRSEIETMKLSKFNNC